MENPSYSDSPKDHRMISSKNGWCGATARNHPKNITIYKKMVGNKIISNIYIYIYGRFIDGLFPHYKEIWPYQYHTCLVVKSPRSNSWWWIHHPPKYRQASVNRCDFDGWAMAEKSPTTLPGLVICYSSPWDFDGPNRNRWWLPNLIAWWIFPWQTVNVITRWLFS